MSEKAIVYDICAVPEGVNLDKIMQVWKEHDVLIYDSFKGKTPFIHDLEDTSKVLLDISEADQEKINQINKLLQR